MKYPLFENISLFVGTNNININYKDISGQTSLMYLINNVKPISTISKDVFNNAFKSFLKNKDLEIGITNNYNISAFGFCLMTGLIDWALTIFETKISNDCLLNFNSEILLFIINCINQPKEFKKMCYFLITFGTGIKFYLDITFNDFDNINQRTLLHYIFMFSEDDNSKVYMFKHYHCILNQLKIDTNKKDTYKRIALFYLFIDENEKIKNNDPSVKLEFCLKNSSFGSDNLDDIDIYGNTILFYAVLARAYKSIKNII